MIRIALVSALLLSLPAPAAPSAPPPPPPPARHWPQFNFQLPEIPELPEIPDLPELEELENLPDLHLPRMLARNNRPHRAHDEDNDDEDDSDNDDDHDDDDEDVSSRADGGVRVYQMNRQRIVIPRTHIRTRDDHEVDERKATGQARGSGSARLGVKGPVNFEVRAQSGDIEVVTTDRPEVSISLTDAPMEEVALYAYGDRVEPAFRGRRLLRRGKLHVELPRGSHLDVSSMSGDVSAQRVGEVRIRTLSGDVKLAGVAKIEIQSISGDVRIDDALGPVRLHLVSGRATVQTAGSAPQLEFQSASGTLDWNGFCARDCHLSAETVSGELRLAVDPKSSFELSYTSHSGELRDEANLTVKHAPRRKHGMTSGWLEATFGKGEGVIEADAFSGNLVVRKR